MANELGHLPKVEELNDLDRLRLETWYDKAYSDDNLFRTLANDPATLEMFLSWVGQVYSGEGGFDREMIEMCRIRMANVNECFH